MASDQRAAKPRNSSKAREANTGVQRRIRNSRRGMGDVADWMNANSELVIKAISKISAKQCAIQFGLTRDGGSYVIRIVGDGEPYNEFVRPTEDLDLYLEGLIEDFS